MAEGREPEQERTMKRILLIISCISLAIGSSGGPLMMRLYFIHGGHRVSLSSFLQNAGFPIILLPLAISYFCRGRGPTSTNQNTNTKTNIVSMNPRLFFAFAAIGVLIGLDAFLYAYGVARLPISTSSLISATELVFTAVFAFFLVRQKFTAYSVNAIVLLTVGAGVLAMHTSGDRPAGESTKEYVIGFVIILVASALYGFVSPLIELVYKKSKQNITYSLVMEIQLVICMVATIFNTVGMIINNDFKVISREARQFELGKANYCVVLVGIAILWQAYYLGLIGVIFLNSSLLSGIIISIFLPVTEVLAVIFYKEIFQAEKGVALVLSLFGFISYFYGEFEQAKKMKSGHVLQTDLLHNP